MQTNNKLAKNQFARNAQRIAAVQQLRAGKNAVRKQVAAQQAYQLAAMQLAAQYGLPAPVFNTVSASARANSATVAPSVQTLSVGGVQYKPCKAVHALCATLPATATRAEMLQLCTDNGINSATASTQVGVYRKAAAAAAQ